MPLIELDPAVRAMLGRDHKLLIGGDWRDPSGGDGIDIVNPADEARLGRIAEASTADVDRAVAAARQAFDDGPWPRMSPADRARLLQRIADAIEVDSETLAQLETLDNGKPIMLARGTVAAAVGAFRYFAGWADKITGTTHHVSMPGDHHSYTLREPVGVVALITPWNFPIVMAAMKLAPALAAGCTVVLKPAEDTSLSALRLAQILLDTGLPPGVLNLVTGCGRTVGAALVAHPDVDKIAFTGSTETGRAVAAAAGANLKKVSLELGGKSPNIVLADADLDLAIAASAIGICFNSGQICTAPSRLYVDRSIHDRVVAGVADAVRGVVIAPGLDPASQMGPLISRRQFDRVTGYIDTGRREGGDIVTGGNRRGDSGFFVEPTIIAGTTNAMTVTREEIFGPVLVVQPFDDIDEAVRLANDSVYGLAATVWTRDLGHAHRLARRIRAGFVSINTVAAADWDLPLGGVKQSGHGREKGLEGLGLYLETRSVVMAL